MDLEAIGKTITGKKIAIGVIDHHTLQVESPDEVAAQIRAALKYIPPERLVISSDCGMGREGMSRRHAFYKMVSLVLGTNMVRKELGFPKPNASPPTSAIRWWCRRNRPSTELPPGWYHSRNPKAAPRVGPSERQPDRVGARGSGKAVELLFSSLWLAIMAWLIARAVQQRGLLPRLDRAVSPPAERAPHITVVVPARDEEANIGTCLGSLLAQDYPDERLHVVVVDDHSADRTAAIVEDLARTHPRIALIRSPPLPPRWIGKAHACAIGARAAAPESEWLCFIDADVTRVALRAVERLAGRLVAASRPALADAASGAEKRRRTAHSALRPHSLVLPAGPARSRRRAPAARSRATGQFMLVRRDAYEAVGGHAAVCTAICEDLEFARRLKQSGHAVLLMGGDKMLATRMYTGWGTLWPGLAKNLVDTFGGPATTLGVALAAVIVAWAAYLLPLFDVLALRSGADAALSATLLALAGSGAAIRAAHCGGILFSHSFLVRFRFSARLHGGSAHGSRQCAPPAQRPGDLEGPNLFMKLPRQRSDEQRAIRARPCRRPARFRRDPRHHDRRGRPDHLSLFHQTDFAALRARRHRRVHLDAGSRLGGQADADCRAYCSRSVLFLLLFGVTALVLVFAGQRLLVEGRGIAADLQSIIENFTRQAIGDQPISLFGSTVNAHDIAEGALDRLRDWAGQSDQLGLLTEYSLAFVMGAFLTVVLLFYFLVSGRQVAHGIFWIVPPHRRPWWRASGRGSTRCCCAILSACLRVVVYATIAAYIGLGVILGHQPRAFSWRC